MKHDRRRRSRAWFFSLLTYAEIIPIAFIIFAIVVIMLTNK